MLTSDERETLTLALTNFLKNNGVMKLSITPVINDVTFESNFPFEQVENVNQCARLVVSWLEMDGWQHMPSWMKRVLKRLLLMLQRPELCEIMQRVEVPPPMWPGATAPDPFDDLWLMHLGMPFVDRTTLRGELKLLAHPVAGPAVLIVNGGEDSGKSYTIELLHHVAVRQALDSLEPGAVVPPKPMKVGRVKHRPTMGASLNPSALAVFLVEEMLGSIGDKPAGLATPERMNDYYSDWVLKKARESKHDWWLVLDGLSDPDIPDITWKFISKLLEKASGIKTGKIIRLILVDCPPRKLVGPAAGQTTSESVGPIGEVDLEPFFRQLMSAPGATPISPTAALAFGALTLRGLPADRPRLEALNHALVSNVIAASIKGFAHV